MAQHSFPDGLANLPKTVSTVPEPLAQQAPLQPLRPSKTTWVYPPVPPIVQAIYDGNYGRLQQFLSSGEDFSTLAFSYNKDDTPLFAAIRGKNVQMVRAILEICGLPKNTPGTNIRVNELLHEAIRVAPDCPDTPEMVKLLIDYGVESVNNGCEGSPLTLLLSYGRGTEEEEFKRLEVVKMLLSKGAGMNEVDYDGGTACLYAARNGLSEILELLMKEKSFDLNEKKAFLQLSGDSDTELGADINTKTAHGRTALHFCAYDVPDATDAWRGLDIAKILIANGADVNAKTSSLYEWSPLHILAEIGDSADRQGRTPLQIFVLRKVVNGKKSGETSSWGEDLEKLVEAESIDMVKLLLENGAEVDAEMENGCTALDAATEFGLGKISKMLLEAGSKAERRKWNYGVPSKVIQPRGRGEQIQWIYDHYGTNAELYERRLGTGKGC